MLLSTTEGEEAIVASSVRYAIGVDEAGRGCMAGPVGVAAALFALSKGPTPYTVQDSKQMSEGRREDTLTGMCQELGDTDSARFLQAVLTNAEQGTSATMIGEGKDGRRLLAITALLVDVETINTRNILNATLEGMANVCAALIEACNRRSRGRLTPQNCVVFIDGHRTPWSFLEEEKRAAVRRTAERKPESAKRVGIEYSILRNFSCTTVVKGDGSLLSIAAASIAAKVSRDAYVVRVLDPQHPQYLFAQHKGYCTAEHTRLLREHGPCPAHRLDYAPVKAASSLADCHDKRGRTAASGCKRQRERKRQRL